MNEGLGELRVSQTLFYDSFFTSTMAEIGSTETEPETVVSASVPA